jgi:hypothetical protein
MLQSFRDVNTEGLTRQRSFVRRRALPVLPTEAAVDRRASSRTCRDP